MLTDSLLVSDFTEAIFARKTVEEESVDNLIDMWTAQLIKVTEEERFKLFRQVFGGENQQNIDVSGLKAKVQDVLTWLWFSAFRRGHEDIVTGYFSNHDEDVAEFADGDSVESLKEQLEAEKRLLKFGDRRVRVEAQKNIKKLEKQIEELEKQTTGGVRQLTKEELARRNQEIVRESRRLSTEENREIQKKLRDKRIAKKSEENKEKQLTSLTQKDLKEGRIGDDYKENVKRLREIKLRQSAVTQNQEIKDGLLQPSSDPSKFLEEEDFGRIYVRKRGEYIANTYAGDERDMMLKVFNQLKADYEKGDGETPPAVQKYFERNRLLKNKGIDTIRGRPLQEEGDEREIEAGSGIKTVKKRISPRPLKNLSRTQELDLYEQVIAATGNDYKTKKGKYNVRRIVETEVVAAYNTGRLHSMYLADVRLVRWVNDIENRRNGRVCQKCTIRAMGTSVKVRQVLKEQDMRLNTLSGIYTIEEVMTDRQLALPVHPFCFTGETLVTLKNGSKKRIDEIQIGEQIETSTVDCYNTDTSVKRISKRLYSGEIITLVLEDGRQIRTTPDHPFWTGEYYSAASLLEEGQHLHVFERVVAEARNVFERSIFNKEYECKSNFYRSGCKSNNNRQIVSSSGDKKINTGERVIYEKTRRSNKKSLLQRIETYDRNCENVQLKKYKVKTLDDKLRDRAENKFGKSENRVVKRDGEREKNKTSEICERGYETKIYGSMGRSFSSCCERKNVNEQSYERSRDSQKSKRHNRQKNNEWRNKNYWQTKRTWFLSGRFATFFQIFLGSKFCENFKPFENRVGLRKEKIQTVEQHDLYSRFLSTTTGLLHRGKGLVYGQGEKKDRNVQTGTSIYKTSDTGSEIISSPHARFKTHRKLRIVQKKIEKVVNILVYNIHVNNDEVYLANDIVVHNCLCSIRPLTRDEETQLVQSGVLPVNGVAGTAAAIAVASGVGVAGTNNGEIAKKDDNTNWWYGALAVGGTAVAIGAMMWYLRRSLTSKYAAQLMQKRGVTTMGDVAERSRTIAPFDPPTQAEIDRSLKITEDLAEDVSTIKPQRYNRTQLERFPELGTRLPDLATLPRELQQPTEDLLLATNVESLLVNQSRQAFNETFIDNDVLRRQLQQQKQNITNLIENMSNTYNVDSPAKPFVARSIIDAEQNLSVVDDLLSRIDNRKAIPANRLDADQLRNVFDDIAPQKVNTKDLQLNNIGGESFSTKTKEITVDIGKRFADNGVVDKDIAQLQQFAERLNNQQNITLRDFREIRNQLRRMEKERVFTELAVTRNNLNVFAEVEDFVQNAPQRLSENTLKIYNKRNQHNGLLKEVSDKLAELKNNTQTYGEKLKAGSVTDPFLKTVSETTTTSNATIRAKALTERNKAVRLLETALINPLSRNKQISFKPSDYAKLDWFNAALEDAGKTIDDITVESPKELLNVLREIRDAVIAKRRNIETAEFTRFQKKWAQFGAPL